MSNCKSSFNGLEVSEVRQRFSARARLVSYVLCAVLLALAISSKFNEKRFASELEENSRTAESAAPSQQLWESADSQNHNPYYNVFRSPSETKRRWTSHEVRERVWQTLKDVEAMENHIEQQNSINARMKKEVYDLDAGLTREKRIVQLIINEGMDDVDHRLDLLQEAISSNVSAVAQTLRELSNEARIKQEEQDQAIATLKDRHIALAAEARNELNQVIYIL